MRNNRDNQLNRRFFIALIFSIALHILVAGLVFWWMNRKEKETPLEKTPITPFEVAVIEEEEKEPGKKLPPSPIEAPIPPAPIPPPTRVMPKPPPKPRKQPHKRSNPPRKRVPKREKEERVERKTTPKKEEKPAENSETDESSQLPRRSAVFVDNAREAETSEDSKDSKDITKYNWKISNEIFEETIAQPPDPKLTMKLRGQKRFVNFDDQMQMAKVTLRNVSGGTIRPGNHKAVQNETAEEFLKRLHDYIHRKWAMQYIPRLNSEGSNRDRINDMRLNTEIELVLEGSTGKPLEVVIARSSGVFEFDSEAVMVTKASATTGVVPRSLWSENGRVYIHWNYWRDQRQCGIFGANVYLLDKGGRKTGSVAGKE